MESAEKPLESALLAQALLQAPIAMALLGEDAEILTVNPAFCQLLARPASALEQRPWHRLVEPAQRDATAALLRHLLAGSQPSVQRPVQLLLADGQPLSVLMLASRLCSDGRSLLIVQLLPSSDPQPDSRTPPVEDGITVTETMPAGTYVATIDAAGQPRFAFVSDRWLRMLDLQREDVLPNPGLAFDCFHPDDRDGFDRLQQEVITQSRPLHWEGRMVVRGETRWVRIESTPRRSPSGALVWEGVMVDITQQQLAMAELEQERALLNTVLTHIDALVYMKDREGRYLYANPSAARLLNPGGGGVQGRRDVDLLPPEVAAPICEVDEQVFRLGAPCCYEQTLPVGAGAERVFLTQKLPYRHPGQPDRLIGFCTDITELRHATRQLTASEEHFRLLAANATDVVFRLSPDGSILWVSPSLTAALGWQPEQWIGRHATDFLLHSGNDEAYRATLATLRAGGATRARDQVRASDGSIHWVETLASPYRNASGRLDGFVASFRTIDQQVEAELQLQKLATTDGLTGVANRRQLEILINQAIDRADRYGEVLCLILCDVDHFKAINDRHGHPCGDQVLVAFSDRLRQQLRGSDAFGRWGGEEFLILVPHSDAAAAHALARKLCQDTAASPFPGVGTVTASFGVAQRRPQEPAGPWLQRVDAALYAAKAAGRNCVCSA